MTKKLIWSQEHFKDVLGFENEKKEQEDLFHLMGAI